MRFANKTSLTKTSLMNEQSHHRADRVTRLAYCQYLLSSPVNYTITHFAEHAERFSHDAINRYLAQDRIPPRLVWQNVQGQIVFSPNGFLVFDDVVLNKHHAHKIALVRRQWSGNAKQVIKGIGVVTCVYVNPDTDQFWVIDYRIFAPDVDHKSKLDHLREMLHNAVVHKHLPFRVVLMDTWYAAKDELLFIERLGKVYYCPIKDNRKVSVSRSDPTYYRADELAWSQDDLRHGRLVHLKDFPAGHQVKLFRLVLSTKRTDHVATNDMTQDSTQAAQEVCGLRWKIEQFHREILRGQAGFGDAGEGIEGTARQMAGEAHGVESVDDDIAAQAVLLPHMDHVGFAVDDGLEGGFLADDAGAEHRILVNSHHGIDQFNRAACVTNAKTSHGIRLGKSVQKDGAFIHPGERGDADVLALKGQL